MRAQNQVWHRIRSGAWLTADRVSGYLRLLASANGVFLVLAICRAHGWLLPREPHFATEFLSFYAAGTLVNAGHAAMVYAPGMEVHAFIPSYNMPPAHAAMEASVAHDPRVLYFGFFYPPVFWLGCAPLARLAYAQAYLAWVGGTGLLLAFLLRRLLGGWTNIWPALAYLPVLENAGVGENAFLSASLIGFGLLALEDSPLTAGACFGALCYKPHFLAPALLLLLFGRQWRALLAAGASAGLLCLLSALLFGWQNWLTYFTVTVPHAEWIFSHAGVAYDLQVTPSSAIRLLGGGAHLASLVQAGAAGFAIVMMFLTRHARPNIRAATLTASFPLLTSVMLGYDLTITGLAILFLGREAAATAYLPYEKTACTLLFALPLIVWALRTEAHVPLDPLIPMAFLLVLLGRLRA